MGKIGNNINNYNKYTSIVEQTGSDAEKVSTPWTGFGAERNRRIFKIRKKLKT